MKSRQSRDSFDYYFALSQKLSSTLKLSLNSVDSKLPQQVNTGAAGEIKEGRSDDGVPRNST